MTQTIHLRVNGTEHTVEVPPQRLLIDCLRYDLGLTGTKEGCNVGVWRLHRAYGGGNGQLLPGAGAGRWYRDYDH